MSDSSSSSAPASLGKRKSTPNSFYGNEYVVPPLVKPKPQTVIGNIPQKAMTMEEFQNVMIIITNTIAQFMVKYSNYVVKVRSNVDGQEAEVELDEGLESSPKQDQGVVRAKPDERGLTDQIWDILFQNGINVVTGEGDQESSWGYDQMWVMNLGTPPKPVVLLLQAKVLKLVTLKTLSQPSPTIDFTYKNQLKELGKAVKNLNDEHTDLNVSAGYLIYDNPHLLCLQQVDIEAKYDAFVKANLGKIQVFNRSAARYYLDKTAVYSLANLNPTTFAISNSDSLTIEPKIARDAGSGSSSKSRKVSLSQSSGSSPPQVPTVTTTATTTTSSGSSSTNFDSTASPAVNSTMSSVATLIPSGTILQSLGTSTQPIASAPFTSSSVDLGSLPPMTPSPSPSPKPANLSLVSTDSTDKPATDAKSKGKEVKKRKSTSSIRSKDSISGGFPSSIALALVFSPVEDRKFEEAFTIASQEISKFIQRMNGAGRIPDERGLSDQLLVGLYEQKLTITSIPSTQQFEKTWGYDCLWSYSVTKDGRTKNVIVLLQAKTNKKGNIDFEYNGFNQYKQLRSAVGKVKAAVKKEELVVLAAYLVYSATGVYLIPLKDLDDRRDRYDGPPNRENESLSNDYNMEFASGKYLASHFYQVVAKEGGTQ